MNLRRQRPTEPGSAAESDRVLTDPRFRTAAARIGSELAQAPGAAGFAAVIDDVVAGHAGGGADRATPGSTRSHRLTDWPATPRSRHAH